MKNIYGDREPSKDKLSDSKVKLMARLKVSRNCHASNLRGEGDPIHNDQVIISNQMAIMNALCDLLK